MTPRPHPVVAGAAALGAAAALLAPAALLTPTASAATTAATATDATATATTTGAVTNGGFAQPGIEGAAPTSWSPVDLGAEYGPRGATSVDAFDAHGATPPPAGTPGGGWAARVLYEVGVEPGVIGYGARQALDLPVSLASSADLTWSVAQAVAPSTALASWAGAAVELTLASGSTVDTLVYVNPLTPNSGDYTGSALLQDSTRTRYVLLGSLAQGSWTTNAARNVADDALVQFGLTSFTVTSVTVATLEDRTSESGGYPDMTAWYTGISLQG